MKDAGTMVKTPPQGLTAKQILAAYVVEKGISPVRFAALTGFTYSHSWDLLRGRREPTNETLGRLVRAGLTEVAERMAKAMEAQAA